MGRVFVVVDSNRGSAWEWEFWWWVWVVGGIAGCDKNVKCLNVLDGHGVDDSGVSGTGLVMAYDISVSESCWC